MNFKKLSVATLVLSLVFVLAECGTTSKFYTPSEVNVSEKATLADLNQGRTLLFEKCSGCHRVPAPSKHSAAEWMPVLNDMQELAVQKNIIISNTENDLIYKYLTSQKKY